MKLMKHLALGIVLFTMAACSASGSAGGNNTGGGGAQTLFDRLIGRWQGNGVGGGDTVFVFTSTTIKATPVTTPEDGHSIDATLDTDKTIKLDGNDWALYTDGSVYYAFYPENGTLYGIFQNTKEDLVKNFMKISMATR